MRTQESISRPRSIAQHVAMAASACALCACTNGAPKVPAAQVDQQRYDYQETRDLVALVNDAAKLIETDGATAFATLRVPDSRWRQQETYIFVLDPAGTCWSIPTVRWKARTSWS